MYMVLRSFRDGGLNLKPGDSVAAGQFPNARVLVDQQFLRPAPPKAAAPQPAEPQPSAPAVTATPTPAPQTVAASTPQRPRRGAPRNA